MIYTKKIEKAIKFSIKTHEVYQKQKRKGKDIPYIIHPLTVGIILSRITDDEDIIIAGILHDTIEDSIENEKVTKSMISERFCNTVANLVISVTEENKKLPWEERKKEAIKHIENFSNDSVLIKSADVISNVREIYSDFEKIGNNIFKIFGGSKEKVLENYKKVINALISKWQKNPLKKDLEDLKILIAKMQK